MANILGLALKVTGDASGLAPALTPVDRALANLAKQAERATAAFNPLTEASAGAARAQEQFAGKFAALAEQLQSKAIGPKEYAAAFGRLTEEAKSAVAVFQRGIEVTQQYTTAEERRASQLQEIADLLKQGAISEETAARARAQISGANELAAKAEKDRSDAVAAASRIIQANLTPQERYDQQIQELRGHLDAGRLTQEQYNRAAAKARADLQGVSEQADKTGKNIASLASNVRILAGIEIGRLIVDGLQTLGSVFTSVTNQITSLVSTVNSSVDSLNDLSARTGIGVEQLQKYGFAAKLAGVDTAEFGSAVQKLAVNIGKATPGGELDKSLREINLSVTQLRALAPEQQFSVIGEAISQLPTAADRAAAAVAVFGKQGAALAPLFREGAASIEELQARAERLGIIISETQVNNVADMNDAFDTVRATIEGIIGQVLGNLAPAVTKVLEDLLRFVETYQNAAGETGGTAFASAITDAFIQGARLFVGILERFAAVAKQVATTLGVDLRSDAEKKLAELEAKVATGLAPEITVPGSGGFATKIDPNFLEELRALRKQVATETEDSVFNATTKWIDDFEANIKQARLPEVQLATNIEATRERFQQFFADAKEQSVELADSFRLFAGRLAFAKADGEITADEMKQIQESVTEINKIMDKELATRRELEAATKAQADADEKRIASLAKSNDAQTKLAEDLAAVEREQARVQQELNAARDASDTQRANEAAARLAQLDQYQASLEEQQQAVAQGFADGFTKSFDATSKGIEDLIKKTGEFSQEAQIAAQNLRDGVAETQDKVRSGGFLSREAYEAEIAARRQAFEIAIQAIRTEEQEKLAAAKRVDDFLRQGIDARRQAEIDAAKQLEERKKQAEQNVAAIRQRIAEEERRNEADREAGRIREAREGANRLRQLRGLQREEERIANGAAGRVRQTLAQATTQQNDAFNQFADAATQQVQQFTNAIAGGVNDINAAMAASADGLRKIAREQRASLTLGSQVVQTADVRTAEGAALVLGLAANAQDPRLIEARLTNKVLRQVAAGLTNNLNRIGIGATLL